MKPFVNKIQRLYDERDNRIFTMFESGTKVRDLAALFDMTRQRVWQIINEQRGLNAPRELPLDSGEGLC